MQKERENLIFPQLVGDTPLFLVRYKKEKGIKARAFNYHSNFYSLSAIVSVISLVVLEFVLL